MIIYLCEKCGGKLVKKGEDYVCEACGMNYIDISSIVDGDEDFDFSDVGEDDDYDELAAFEPGDNYDFMHDELFDEDWQQFVVDDARALIDNAPYSKKALLAELEKTGYSHEQAVFGVKKSKINWDVQARLAAAALLEDNPYSRQELIDELESGGFSHEQATFGADMCGWMLDKGEQEQG